MGDLVTHLHFQSPPRYDIIIFVNSAIIVGALSGWAYRAASFAFIAF